MSNSYLIEVAVPEGTSNTERGRVLERFARRFLETQNYKITEELRVTASEMAACTQRLLLSDGRILDCLGTNEAPIYGSRVVGHSHLRHDLSVITLIAESSPPASVASHGPSSDGDIKMRLSRA